MRSIALCWFLIAFAGGAFPACRDCAEGALGGPADNPFVRFDEPCSHCRAAGLPDPLVNTATLNLHVRVTDLPPGTPRGLALERAFNLDDDRTGRFGKGWSSNLAETLRPGEDGARVLRGASGRVDTFAPALESGSYFAVTATTGVLRRNPDGTFRLTSPGSPIVRTFSAEGNLLFIDEGALRRATFEYDAAGRLLRARGPATQLELSYDPAGRVTSVADALGRTVSYTYNDDGTLASWTGAAGEAVTWRYDDAGRPVSVAAPGGAFTFQYGGAPDAVSLAAVTLPDGAVRQYDTPQPRQVRVSTAAGSVTYACTAQGLLESVTDAAGNRTAYAYDAAGRPVRAVNPAGEATRFDYDMAGNLSAVTGIAGGRWSADSDSSGRPVRVSDPNGNAWLLRYGADGALASVTSPLGSQTAATRNELGLIATLTGPNGGRDSFRYDASGLLVEAADPLGGAWQWQYDGAGRVAALTAPDGATISAQYDARNRLTGAASGDARIALSPGIVRDSLQRVSSYTDSFGNTVGYVYDAAGRLATLTLPPGAVTYEYDKAGRLSKVADWAGNFALYRYDAAGSLTSVNVSGGPLTIYQYDAARRLAAVVSTGADGTVAAAYRYTADANGNRTSAAAREPLDAAPPPVGVAFTYDAANHPASRDDGAIYRYDAAGRLVAVDGPHPAALAYDPFGRLETFTLDGSATTYAYGGAGLPVERRRDGVVRRYLYDLSGPHPRLLAETDGAGTPLAWYVYGLGLLWQIDAAGLPWFYHFDGSGNVVAVSSPTAGVVNRYRYDPLGRLAAAEETVDNPFRARGESGWRDDANGLLYGGGAFEWPAARVTLPAALRFAPPEPTLTPPWRGPAACFFEGVAVCAFASAGGPR